MVLDGSGGAICTLILLIGEVGEAVGLDVVGKVEENAEGDHEEAVDQHWDAHSYVAIAELRGR